MAKRFILRIDGSRRYVRWIVAGEETIGDVWRCALWDGSVGYIWHLHGTRACGETPLLKDVRREIREALDAAQEPKA